MTEQDQALIKYRMERAHETIDEAKTLFDAGYFNMYVSRLFYACFYAMSALLLTKNLSSSKHSYLRSLMHREFVKPGLIPMHLGKHFDRLFDNRQKGDYEDFVKFKSEDVEGWMKGTQEFIAHVESLIATV